MINLKTPVSDEEISNLNVGDKVSISGVMYTGRDAALPQLVDLIKKDNRYKDITMAGPGFINISFSDEKLMKHANELNDNISINYKLNDKYYITIAIMISYVIITIIFFSPFIN